MAGKKKKGGKPKKKGGKKDCKEDGDDELDPKEAAHLLSIQVGSLKSRLGRCCFTQFWSSNGLTKRRQRRMI